MHITTRHGRMVTRGWSGEHAILWRSLRCQSAYFITVCGRKPGQRRRKASSSVSFSTAVRLSRKGRTVALFQPIRYFLFIMDQRKSSSEYPRKTESQLRNDDDCLVGGIRQRPRVLVRQRQARELNGNGAKQLLGHGRAQI